MSEWVLALDVGGTKLAAGLVDRQGRVSAHREVPTLARQGGGPAVMGRLIELCRSLLRENGFKPVEAGWAGPLGVARAVGVGTGGQVEPTSGAVAFANENIPGWTGMPLRERLETALGLPAQADNDANCAALAEATWGAGRGRSVVLCVTMGTGIGGGLVIDGQLYRGARGGALEAGHILVDYAGLPCVCGLRGCLEMYASGPSILAEFMRRHGDEGVRQLLEVEPAMASTRDVVAAARRGVAPAVGVVQYAGAFLGIGLASMAHMLDPSLIVVGGGMSDVWDLLYPSLHAAFVARSMPGTRYLPIVRAQMGQAAGLSGAGQLAWQRLGAG